MLAIGFATVSTTLIISGTIGVGADTDDYDIVFTSAKIGDTPQTIKKTNKSADTIEFDVLLNKVGEAKVLEYTVKNNSTQYEANANMKCYAVNDTDEFMTKYITISGELAGKTVTFAQEVGNSLLSDEINFKAQESKNGTITMSLKKSYAGESEISVTLKCEIITNADSSDEVEDYEEGTYKLSAVLLNGNNEPQSNLDIAIFSKNSVKFTTTDASGKFTLSELDKGIKNLYYDDDGYENRSQSEIEQTAEIKIEFTTDGKVVEDINGYKLTEIEVDEIQQAPEGWTLPMYFAYGRPTTSSTTDYTTLGKNVFNAIDNAGNKGVCISPTINGTKKLECFKNKHATSEIIHLSQVATQVNGYNTTCSIDKDCYFGSFVCVVSATGDVICISGSLYCTVSSTGNLRCDSA